MATLAARIDALAGAVRDKINLLTPRITALEAQGRTGTTALGYAAGAGGVVTQASSKATAVTLNKLSGEITMNAAALAAATIVTFVFNNSTVALTDQVVCTHHSGGTFGSYTINARVTGAGVISVAVRNNSAASLSEAVVIKFNVIKSAVA